MGKNRKKNNTTVKATKDKLQNQDNKNQDTSVDSILYETAAPILYATPPMPEQFESQELSEGKVELDSPVEAVGYAPHFSQGFSDTRRKLSFPTALSQLGTQDTNTGFSTSAAIATPFAKRNSTIEVINANNQLTPDLYDGVANTQAGETSSLPQQKYEEHSYTELDNKLDHLSNMIDSKFFYLSKDIKLIESKLTSNEQLLNKNEQSIDTCIFTILILFILILLRNIIFKLVKNITKCIIKLVKKLATKTKETYKSFLNIFKKRLKRNK